VSSNIHPDPPEPVIAQTFGCSAELAQVIAARARFAQHPPRAVIVAADRTAAMIYLVLAGHAQAYALSIDARLVVIEDFYQGALFGEAGLVSVAAPQLEVIAVDQVRTGQFANHAFIALIETHSCVALTVSRLLTERLINTTRRMVAVTTLSAPGRIHAELHRQAEASGNWTLRPAPVLSEFARLVQSTRESVSRAMSALEKRGIISRSGESLVVIAPHRLEELIY
jgi:CRP/FNR family cyclic AMP-dependent transcriptional regulator